MLRTILAETSNYLSSNKIALWTPLLLPCVALVLLDIFISLDWIKNGILSEVAYTLILVQVFILTHRLTLIGDESVPPLGIAYWSRREVHFLAYMILLDYVIPGAVVFLATITYNTIGMILLVLAFIAVVFELPQLPNAQLNLTRC